MAAGLDLQQSLLECLSDELGLRLLSLLDGEPLGRIAEGILRDDPYGNNGQLAAALRLTGHDGGAGAAIEHQLWCAMRDARWHLGVLRGQDMAGCVKVEGEEWFRETKGSPTVIVAPMNLGTVDAVRSALYLCERASPGRPLIFYGEAMGGLLSRLPELARVFAPDSPSAVRRIIRVLDGGGLFMTYPDFVYRGHPVVDTRMFGRRRGMSAAFAALCARPETHVLPCVQTRRDGGLGVRFFEPLRIDASSFGAGDIGRAVARQVAARLLGGILEGLVRLHPEQWLLLGTLTHESPQMAGAAAS